MNNKQVVSDALDTYVKRFTDAELLAFIQAGVIMAKKTSKLKKIIGLPIKASKKVGKTTKATVIGVAVGFIIGSALDVV